MLQDDDVRPAGHAVLEAYSVLTRLPEPQRLAAGVARELLQSLPEPAASRADGRAVVSLLADVGVTGGGVYDGLIALSAGAPVFTRNKRAEPVYRRLGAEVSWVS